MYNDAFISLKVKLFNKYFGRVRFSTGMGNDTPALNFRDINLVG